MTTPPAVFGQFGQTLAFAERTLTATLHLGDIETTVRTLRAVTSQAAVTAASDS